MGSPKTVILRPGKTKKIKAFCYIPLNFVSFISNLFQPVVFCLKLLGHGIFWIENELFSGMNRIYPENTPCLFALYKPTTKLLPLLGCKWQFVTVELKKIKEKHKEKQRGIKNNKESRTKMYHFVAGYRFLSEIILYY